MNLYFLDFCLVKDAGSKLISFVLLRLRSRPLVLRLALVPSATSLSLNVLRL